MRVVLVSRAAYPWHGHGGLERHVGGLRKHLERAGVTVSLYTTPPSARREAPSSGVHFVPYGGIPWPRRPGFVVIERDTNYLAWSLRAGKRVLEDGEADVVQADGGAGFGYAFHAGEGSPPLVLHPHGMEEFKAPSLKRTAYLPLRSATRFAARRARRVLAPDVSMRDEVRRYLDVPEERITVVPNAIDLEEIDAAGRRRSVPPIEIGPEETVLLSVGRLERNKNFAGLVRALGKAGADLGDRWTWVLVGEGPERASLEREIARTGIDAKARLVGSVSDEQLAALYRRATLFVHPTLYEGSSMVTLEAMAHGLPVIASRVGGIPDKIVDGESGLIVPPADEEALAESIVKALRAKDALEEWGRRARAIVEERFDWSRRVGELVELYEEILREG